MHKGDVSFGIKSDKPVNFVEVIKFIIFRHLKERLNLDERRSVETGSKAVIGVC